MIPNIIVKPKQEIKHMYYNSTIPSAVGQEHHHLWLGPTALDVFLTDLPPHPVNGIKIKSYGTNSYSHVLQIIFYMAQLLKYQHQ